MESVIVEIRAAEGGEDAKLLVHEQLAVYAKFSTRKGYQVEIVSQRPGIATLRIQGGGVQSAFAQETGGHRYQRVPPTERRGRVHTSTVTVAVLPEPSEAEVPIRESDLDWQYMIGSGAGGQARQKNQTAVRLTHRPSGLVIRSESERSQRQNKANALAVLRARLYEIAQGRQEAVANDSRRGMVGSGQRGDKTITLAIPRDQVTHHRTGRRTTYKRYADGHIEDLVPRDDRDGARPAAPTR